MRVLRGWIVLWLGSLHAGNVLQETREAPVPPPRLVFVPLPPTTAPTIQNWTVLPKVQHVRAYQVISTKSFVLQAPPTQHSAHRRLQPTLTQAKQHHCHIATNGGPFYRNGDLYGGVVRNQTIISPFEDDLVGMGWTVDRRWVLGRVAKAQDLGLVEYVTGFGWLVSDGRPVVLPENHARAPRTAMGVNSQGHLLLLVVDGCEKCLRHRGLTLKELADLLVSVGAQHAIQLDGGSSSTLVVSDKVRNRPTCTDVVPVKCQRPVATIVCLPQQPQQNPADEGTLLEELERDKVLEA